MEKNYTIFQTKNYFKSKIFFLILCFCLLQSFLTIAQPTFQWAKNLGSSSPDVGYSVASDISGNVYTTGSFSFSADFDPGAPTVFLTSAGSTDVFISKLDALGNFVWAKRVGAGSADQGNSICTDASGNVYITGFFQGTVDFDPGASTFNLSSAGGLDVFILKLDALGNFVWAKKIGSTSFDVGNGITTDVSGNVYTTGYFINNVDFDPNAGTFTLTPVGTNDIFVLKLDASGNFLWAKQMGGASNDQGYSIITDVTGNVYTTGGFNATADFDPSASTYTFVSAGSQDIFVSKLDASGNFIWAQQLGGTSFDVAFSIALDASNNVYTTGYFAGTADFDPSASSSTLTSIGGNDIFISKLNSSGNFVYVKQIGSTGADVAQSIATDVAGNIYTTGYFNGVADFDPGAGTNTLTPAGGQDAFILELDAAGNFVLVKQLGGASTEAGNGITTDPSGNVFSTGSFLATTDFNFGGASYTLTSTGNTDIYVHKLNQCLVPPTPTNITPLSNQTACSGLSATLIANGVGTLNWYATPSSTTILNTSSTFITPTLSAGNYSYYVEASTCSLSPSRGVVTLTINSTPIITVNSGSICNGKTFTITPSGANTFTISGGASVVSPTSNTTYNVVGTSALGCVSSNTAISSVTVNALPIISVNSGTICSGNSFTINPSGASTYTFSGGASVVSPTTNSTYNITGTDANGCVSSNTAVSSVMVNALPTVSVNSGAICSGNSFTINPSGANTYTISGGATVVSPTTTTSYNVIGADALGCVSSNTAVSSVTVNALPIITVPSATICSGATGTLTASGANTYTWNTGANTAFITASPVTTTTYNVNGTSAFGCQASTIVTATITVGSAPSIIVNSATVCAGSSATLNASGVTSFTWNTGSNAASIVVTPTSNTTYTVSGNLTGCVTGASNTATVIINALPIVNAISNSSLICTGQNATLTASGATTYTWNTSATTSIIAISPTTTTNYTVTGTNANGCVNMATVSQSVSLCTNIKLANNNIQILNVYPNPFTNKLVVISSELNKSIKIYNALGALVYFKIIETEQTEIDLSQHTNGLYFVKIGLLTKKIIKE